MCRQGNASAEIYLSPNFELCLSCFPLHNHHRPRNSSRRYSRWQKSCCCPSCLCVYVSWVCACRSSKAPPTPSLAANPSSPTSSAVPLPKTVRTAATPLPVPLLAARKQCHNPVLPPSPTCIQRRATDIQMVLTTEMCLGTVQGGRLQSLRPS